MQELVIVGIAFDPEKPALNSSLAIHDWLENFLNFVQHKQLGRYRANTFPTCIGATSQGPGYLIDLFDPQASRRVAFGLLVKDKQEGRERLKEVSALLNIAGIDGEPSVFAVPIA